MAGSPNRGFRKTRVTVACSRADAAPRRCGTAAPAVFWLLIQTLQLHLATAMHWRSRHPEARMGISLTLIGASSKTSKAARNLAAF